MTILYLHGMGGGTASRIPGYLGELLPADRIVIRTYDFNPDAAHDQIASWFDEVKPDVVIGESLGATHALALDGIPVILISPALNAGIYFSCLSPLTLIPGVPWLIAKIFKPHGESGRQIMKFNFKNTWKWMYYRHLAHKVSSRSNQSHFAFIGDVDGYRKCGIVSLCTWRKWFGKGTYEIVHGNHIMKHGHGYDDSERIAFVKDKLIPKINESRGQTP